MNPPLFLKSAFCATTLSLLVGAASAETLLQYQFNGSTLAPSTVAANIVSDDVDWGAGLPSGPNRGFGAGGSSLFARSSIVDEAISATSTDYVEFTLTTASGFVANLSAFSFSYGFTHAGQTERTATFALRSNADNYATNIALFTRNSVAGSSDAVSSGSIGLTATDFQNRSTITFRIFLADDGINDSTNYTLRLDNFLLEGTTAAAVPEPSSFATLLGAVAVGLACLRRRRG